MPPSAEQLYVVDRREGDVCVLVTDAGASIDVLAKQLPPDCRTEGVVMRVPVSATGEPSWKDAKLNRHEPRPTLYNDNTLFRSSSNYHTDRDVTL